MKERREVIAIKASEEKEEIAEGSSRSRREY